MRRSTVVAIALAALCALARPACGEVYITEEGDTLHDLRFWLGHTTEQLRAMLRIPEGVSNHAELQPGSRVVYLSNQDIAEARAWLNVISTESSEQARARYSEYISDLERGDICYREPGTCSHIPWVLVLVYRDQWHAHAVMALPVSAPVTALVQAPGTSKREQMIRRLAAFQPEFPIIGPPQ